MRVFIPWHLVCADASVSGTITNRMGYQLAKQAIQLRGEASLTTFFIHEIGRASRDSIEALQLGQLVDRFNKRMIGISDGFDSNDPMSKMQLHMFAMMGEWFVDQLRQEVRRGMPGAARRGTSTGKPPLGIQLVPVRDSQGNVVLGSDGAPSIPMQSNPEPSLPCNVRSSFGRTSITQPATSPAISTTLKSMGQTSGQ
jgi:hypothetical protein